MKRFSFFMVALFIVVSAQAQSWSELQQLSPNSRWFYDFFGDEVAIGSEAAIVGVGRKDYPVGGITAREIGAAYFYTTSGSLIQMVQASDKAAYDNFGHSVAISGDYAIIGAYREDHDTTGANALTDAGSAYIFEQNSMGQWQETQKLVASDRAVGDYFGVQVSIQGNYAMVGATRQDHDTTTTAAKTNAGAVYIFERNSAGVWHEIQKLVASDRDSLDYFGAEMDQSGDYLVISATGEDHDTAGVNAKSSAGATYIFKHNTNTNQWQEVQKIVASDRDSLDYFGSRLSIYHEWIIVGVSREDHDTTGAHTQVDAGSAYIFKQDHTGRWQETQKLVASNRGAGDRFGSGVAINNNYVIVGAPVVPRLQGGTTYFDGMVYIFRQDTVGQWFEAQQITIVRDNNMVLGSALDMHGDKAIVGAPGGRNVRGYAFILEDDCPSSFMNIANITRCDSFYWALDSVTYTTSGTYEYTYTNPLGCDSTYRLNLTIASSADTQTVSNCYTYTWPVNNQTYTQTGLYTDTLVNSFNCDSVITLDLTINQDTYGADSVMACNNYTWLANNQTYTQTGVYQDTLVNTAGCDSIATLYLTVNYTSIDTQKVTRCDSYTVPGKSQTHTQTGMYVDTSASVFGCDSITYIDLTINKRSYSSHSVTVCGSYTWPANNQTYTQSGVYRDTSVNALGCDSVKVLFLNIKPVHIDSSVVSVCNSYTWPVNQVTYTSSGSYTETLTNTAGCDSVLMLNLTVTQGPTRQIAVNTCNSYTWPVTNQTYTQTGIYQHLKPNGMGCDSILVLDLTLRFDSTYTQHALACGSYTWPVNNQTYTTSGIYQENLTNANGCDSVMILDLTIIPNSSGAVSATACDSYTWPLNNQTYNTTGTYTDTLNNTRGCDSVVTLSLTILESTASTETITACTQYTWLQNNRTYFQSGTYTHTLTNAAGCDSILTLDLTLIKVNTQVTSTGQTLSADLGGATYQWLNCIQQYQPVPGATQQQFVPSSNGNYAVEITENGCTDTSICYAIINLNRSDDWFTQSIKVYPNPTNGHITLELSQPYEHVQLIIRDAQGKQVAQQSFANLQQLTTELKGAKGIYFLELLTSDGQTALFEVIKE